AGFRRGQAAEKGDRIPSGQAQRREPEDREARGAAQVDWREKASGQSPESRSICGGYRFHWQMMWINQSVWSVQKVWQGRRMAPLSGSQPKRSVNSNISLLANITTAVWDSMLLVRIIPGSRSRRLDRCHP